MKIRQAKNTDDFKTIARFIYETDRFIYPYWFKDKNEGIDVLAELLNQKGSSFYYKNCIVAIVDNKIVGVLLYFTDKSKFSFDYSKIIDKNFEYNYVLNNYILKIEKEVNKNQAYIAGVKVDDNYTRRYIASGLINYLFSILSKEYTVCLDVLEENVPAICLYKKVGFKITNTYNGFNGYRKRKPLCYSMIKKL